MRLKSTPPNLFWSGTIDSVAVLSPNLFLVFKLQQNAHKRNFP
jgi:hypothetical protein